MKFTQHITSLVTVLLISACAATTPPKSALNIIESCTLTQKKLNAMADTSAKKSTLQAYYHKRCS